MLGITDERTKVRGLRCEGARITLHCWGRVIHRAGLKQCHRVDLSVEMMPGEGLRSLPRIFSSGRPEAVAGSRAFVQFI
jgi:hypothetical protein